MKTYEGFRKNRKFNLEKSKKFSDFAAQEYIIFLYNEELIYGQIKEYKIHSDPNSFGEIESQSYYLTIDIFDVLTDNGNSWYKPGEGWNFNIDNDSFKLLFKTTSRKDADNEYKRIKNTEPYSEWELNRIAKQYNI